MKALDCKNIEELYEKLGSTKTGNIDADTETLNMKFYLPEILALDFHPIGTSNPELASLALEIEKIKATQKGVDIGNELMQIFANILELEFKSGKIEDIL